MQLGNRGIRHLERQVTQRCDKSLTAPAHNRCEFRGSSQHLRRELLSRCGGVLWNGSLSWRRPSCGIGMRRVSLCGRSAVVWVGLRRRSGPIWWPQGGSVRFLLGIGVRCGCRLGSVRRFHGGWLQASRFGVLPAGWVGRLRRCLVRWLPMVAAGGIGLSEDIEGRGVGHIVRNHPNLGNIRSYEPGWRRNSDCGGHHSRSLGGSSRHILTPRRWGCLTKPSTSPCLSRAKAPDAGNSPSVYVPGEQPDDLRAGHHR